jgi:hypothetical protein
MQVKVRQSRKQSSVIMANKKVWQKLGQEHAKEKKSGENQVLCKREVEF